MNFFNHFLSLIVFIYCKCDLWWIIYRFSYCNWIKNKKATINHINKNDKCFQYAVTVTLNHEEIGKIHKEYQKLSLYKQIQLGWDKLHQKRMIGKG